MAKNQSLAEFFASKGMRLRTWARANGLSENDMALIYEISYGNTQGLRGRAKEIKELLEKEGFKEPLAKSVRSFSKCTVGIKREPEIKERAKTDGFACKGDKKGA